MNQQLQNGSAVLESMARIKEQIASLDRKLDIVISRISSGASSTSSFQKSAATPNAQINNREAEQHKSKVMHQVICADCKKECSVPFKPSNDRPVYCKECFARRRTGNAVKSDFDNKTKEALPVQETKKETSVPAAKTKKKAVVAKKTVVKKKLVAKKKKK